MGLGTSLLAQPKVQDVKLIEETINLITTLNSILGQLDIKQSEFRDALRGVDNRTLTDLYNKAYDPVNDRAKISIENDAVGLAKSTDISTDQPRHITNAYDSTNDRFKISVENDAVGLAKSTDISTDQPRHITNAYDSVNDRFKIKIEDSTIMVPVDVQGSTVAYDSTNDRLKVDAQVVANPPNLDVALSTRASDSTLSSNLPRKLSLDDGTGTYAEIYRSGNAVLTSINEDKVGLAKSTDISTDQPRHITNAYDSVNDRFKISVENDAVGLAKDATLSSNLPRKLSLDDGTGTYAEIHRSGNAILTSLNEDKVGLAKDTNLVELKNVTENLIPPITVPSGYIFIAPSGATTYVYDYIYADGGDIYCDGDILII